MSRKAFRKGIKFRKAAALLAAGLAVGAPLMSAVPLTVMADEAELIILTLKQSEGGQISSNANGTVKEGEVFNLVATPYEGYRFAYWILKCKGSHLLVSGSSTDSSVSAVVNETNEPGAGVYTAEAVFVKDDTYFIDGNGIIAQTTAKAGDIIDLGRPFDSGYREETEDMLYFTHESYSIKRVSDNEDITDEVADKENNTFVMPAADIRIEPFYGAGIEERGRVLDELDGMEQAVFSIENNVGADFVLPTQAEPGEEIEIILSLPNGEVENLSFERKSDGRDVTDDIFISDELGTSFIMPYYDISVKGDIKPLIEEDSTTGNTDNDEEAPAAEHSVEEYVEKVYASVQLEESEVKNAASSETNSSAVSEEKSSEVKDPKNTDEADNTLEISIKEEEKSDAASKDIKTTANTNSVKAKSSAKVSTSPVVRTGEAATAQASPVTVTSRPVAVAAKGSASAMANGVSAPATGDYNKSTALTVIAIAAGAGIAFAAFSLKKRTN